MKIAFLGGASEVGGSAIVVQIDGKNILMDAGIRQSAAKDPLPDYRTLQEMGGVDVIILSHAHLDHIGTLPIISKTYPAARIYMNRMTKDLVRVLLYDSLKIMNQREAEIPFYSEKDVEEMLGRIFPLNYQVEWEVAEGITAAFYQAGHIAGASCIYIQGEEGALFYSGDFSIFAQNSIEGAKIPKLRPDVAIVESTYGDRLHANREVEERRLISLVEECIQRKGKMLIPAFALGRAQEVLLILKKAMNKGRLPKVPVYVDGMVRSVNQVYKYNPLYLKNTLAKKILRGIDPFYDNQVQEVKDRQHREEILESKEPCIIVSSSGMITGGPSQYYAEKIAGVENAAIIFTGYQDEESPGRKLLNLLELPEEERFLQIGERSIPVKCTIERVGLSAHADKGEIAAILNLLTPKHTFLVHGEERVIQQLAKELAGQLRGRIYVPGVGESYELEIQNRRKQFKKQLPYLMSMQEEWHEEALEKLWEFVYAHYEGRLFTVEELFSIWSGKAEQEEDKVEKLQKAVSQSVYFESDARRLFLFKARNREEVEEAFKPKEWKQNELDALVKELFAEYNYRKVGIKLEDKSVVLTFDFPKAVDVSIEEKLQRFSETTNWHIYVNEAANYQAVELLLRYLLKKTEIKKISYLLSENKAVVTVSCDEDYKVAIKEFREKTGMELSIVTPAGIENAVTANEISSEDERTFDPAKAMEQNEALAYLDRAFRGEEAAPYKKSIKGTAGKYIELNFISPVVGRRYESKFRELEEEIGWPLKIGTAVNQNEIFSIIQQLCMEKEIKLKKNPSLNPQTLQVMIKPEGGTEEEFDEIREDFEKKTGCVLVR